jgi:serine/threonine protein phosphatase PrpC
MQFNFKSLSDTGKVRQANEDSYGDMLTPNGHVFVVCDGMGGHVGGARASSLAVQSILQHFSKEEYGNIIQAIDRALIFANEQIYATTLAEPELKGMGTTAVVLVIKNDECYIGHVGDSRIYLKSDGKLNRITKDHSFVQGLVDSGAITDEEAEHHPKKNQILKALGIYPQVEPTICSFSIQAKKGDVFLLCSDGMNGMVNDASMEMMVDADDLDRSAFTLITAANDAGGHDNITVTLVGIVESPYMQSKFEQFNPRPNFASTATQGFVSENPSSGPKLKLWMILSAAAVLVIALGIGAYFFFGKKSEQELTVLPPKGQVVTEEEIGLWPEAEMTKIIGREVETDQDQLLASNGKYIVELEDGKIVSYDVNKDPKENSVSTGQTTTQKKKERIKVEKGKGEVPKDTLSNQPKTPDEPNKNCDQEYKVKTGDNLTSIAKEFSNKGCETTAVQIKVKNNKDNTNVAVDEKLIIPCNCPK